MLDEIMQKLNEHDVKLDEHGRKLDSHSEQLELIASTVLLNSDRLEKIEKKLEELPTAEGLNDAIRKADEVLKRAIDIEQEGQMRTYAIKRLDEQVDANKKDIQRIKPLVGLA